VSAKCPIIIGLTGGIGSGKSAAASRFASHGIVVVDTDLIAHDLTGRDGEAIPRIIEAFGPEMVTPERRLDRPRMRNLVFTEPAARKRLEHILHPMIRAESERQCARASSPYVILAVPLLIESGTYRERCSRVCVVDCPENVQIERVRTRNGLSEDEVRAIIATQISRAARLAAADDVIDNSGTLKALDAQVDVLHASYLALAG
jgi:dephospho-CoA kinase